MNCRRAIAEFSKEAMGLIGKVLKHAGLIGYGLLTTAAITGLPTSRLSSQFTSIAYAQAQHPFTGNSVVYVQDRDRWREAFIQGVSGHFSRGRTQWAYTVEYLDADGGSESGVEPARMVTITDAQTQGLTSHVYDLSTQAGINQMLAAHNGARREVGVADLVWSEALADLAQEWADVLLTEGQLRHRPAAEREGGTIGENLSSLQASAAGGALRHPQRAVQGWLAEKSDYDYESNRCNPGQVCGHYTQIVWAETDAVGCAVARNADQTREVWVCNYSPAGNVVGQRPY